MADNIVFKIDNVDFSDVLAEGGLVWTRNDLDADGTGRDLNGDLIRKRVASKVTLKVQTLPLMTSRISALLTAIYPESFSVTYTDPQAGTQATKTMYANNVPATCQRAYGNTILWDAINFSLVEF